MPQALADLHTEEVTEAFVSRVTAERKSLDAEEDGLIKVCSFASASLVRAADLAVLSPWHSLHRFRMIVCDLKVLRRVVGTLTSHVRVAHARRTTSRRFKYYRSDDSGANPQPVVEKPQHIITALSATVQARQQVIDEMLQVRRERRLGLDKKAFPVPTQRLDHLRRALQLQAQSFNDAAAAVAAANPAFGGAHASLPPTVSLLLPGHRPVLLPCVRIPDPGLEYQTYEKLVGSARSPMQVDRALQAFAWRLRSWLLLDIAAALAEAGDPCGALAHTTPVLELAADPRVVTDDEEDQHRHGGHSHSHSHSHSHGHAHDGGAEKHHHGADHRSGGAAAAEASSNEKMVASRFPAAGGLTAIMVVTALLQRAQACHEVGLLLLSRLHLVRARVSGECVRAPVRCV